MIRIDEETNQKTKTKQKIIPRRINDQQTSKEEEEEEDIQRDNDTAYMCWVFLSKKKKTD